MAFGGSNSGGFISPNTQLPSLPLERLEKVVGRRKFGDTYLNIYTELTEMGWVFSYWQAGSSGTSYAELKESFEERYFTPFENEFAEGVTPLTTMNRDIQVEWVDYDDQVAWWHLNGVRGWEERYHEDREPPYNNPNFQIGLIKWYINSTFQIQIAHNLGKIWCMDGRGRG